jgi:hypothetical protein
LEKSVRMAASRSGFPVIMALQIRWRLIEIER